MLSFIGFIALLILAKFLWDTYFTSTTTKEWNKYKTQEPEKAARIELSSLTDMSTAPVRNRANELQSLEILANSFGCSMDEAEERYISELQQVFKDGGTIEEAEKARKELGLEKFNQAKELRIDPEDTPVAIMERWMSKAIENQRSPKIDKNNYPTLIDTLTSCQSMALDYSKKGGYKNAIEVLNMGLSFGEEPTITPHLYNIRGECHLNLYHKKEALDDFETAIGMMNKYNPNDVNTIALFKINKDKAVNFTKNPDDTYFDDYSGPYDDYI